MASFIKHRPRVLNLSERDTPRLTPLAVAAERSRSTSRRVSAPRADSPAPRSGRMNGARRLREEKPRALVAADTLRSSTDASRTVSEKVTSSMRETMLGVCCCKKMSGVNI